REGLVDRRFVAGRKQYRRQQYRRSHTHVRCLASFMPPLGRRRPRAPSLYLNEAARRGYSAMSLLMESDAFEDGGIVPPKYGCFGANVQPGFKISNVPPGTAGFALIFHDIDVALDGRTEDGLHWIAWN